jgi:hypothetical protein
MQSALELAFGWLSRPVRAGGGLYLSAVLVQLLVRLSEKV